MAEYISRAFDIVRKPIFAPSQDRPLVRPYGNAEYQQGEPLENYVLFFAGHGAPQSAGMEKALTQVGPIQTFYDSLSTSLGYDLSRLSNQELAQTEYAQPAIAAYNIASCLIHESANPDEVKNDPYTITGQSAGLGSAAWRAGMYGPHNTVDAAMVHVDISAERGRIMQKIAGPDYAPSGHMLISAGDRKKAATEEEKAAIDFIRQETLAREKPASLAIDISDGRIILGGTSEALTQARELYKNDFGELNINFFRVPTSNVGFHTEAMRPVADEIYELFEKQRENMQDPLIPILSNTGQFITTVDEYIAEQVRLVTEPVFARDMNNMLTENGIDTGLEFGERGIIAKSMDGFELTPRKVAAGTALTAGAAVIIGTGYLVKRRK